MNCLSVKLITGTGTGTGKCDYQHNSDLSRSTPRLTLIPACITNPIYYKMWDEIYNTFPNFNGATVDVWEWISNFITFFIMDLITSNDASIKWLFFNVVHIITYTIVLWANSSQWLRMHFYDLPVSSKDPVMNHKDIHLMTNEVWWRHQMETFSALLAICAGNSPVTGESPTQRPVTRSFDIFFDLSLNKRLSKQSWG